MSKILKILLIFLIIILIGEGAYLFYLSNLSKTETQKNDLVDATPSQTLTQPILTITPEYDKLSNEGVLKTAESLIEKGVAENSYFINKYKSVIIGLYKDKINSPFKEDPSYIPIFHIELGGIKDGVKFKWDVYFDEEELSKLIVTKQEAGNLESSYNDLIIGQEIVIESTWDLIEYKYKDYKITIL